jgi:hypothetical protein
LGALACLLLAGGCSTNILPKQPDIGALYSRSAQSHGPERNPVIVIPGLTGSNLVEGATGRSVWGTFVGDFAQPTIPEDVRLIALPMREGESLRELRDNVVSDGVLDRVRVKILGIPINLRAYYYILQALGVGGYRDQSLAISGQIDWGDEHFNCFQFDYDWRRDNVENAQRLHLFIEEKRAYVQAQNRRRYGVDTPDLRFDIVSHSMGGLLLRYYLRYGAADLPEDGSLPEVTWAGAANVERAILVATPNAGTIESLVQLVEGKDYGPFASYSPVLLGTFPSGYQMLPRGRHAMVVEGEEPIEDLFDPQLWRRMEWGMASPGAEQMLAWLLPEVDDPEVRRRIALDHQRKALERASRFTAALDQPADKPPALQLFLVAGDAIATPRRAIIEEGKNGFSIAATGAGDGKVLRSSALMDERMDGDWHPYLRSPIDWQSVMFLPEAHLELTKTAVFTDNLLFWLLEEPRQRTP